MMDQAPAVVLGQRLVSDSEPELGLGTLVSADGRSLIVRFDAADEIRQYAASSAPLHRVIFAEGDEITDLEGQRLRVDAIEHRGGLVFYLCGERVVPEAELSPRMALSGPRERLLDGRFDTPSLFDLRREALDQLEKTRRSAVRGLLGPRLELLPHQFYIASEITSRRRPRVLLADQTGLGKTIEACLILHRLLLTGRVRRSLILVPDALVHQWLVELSRRFNLRVALFDEERCRAIEESEPESNPFESEQIVLTGWSLLVSNSKRTEQASSAGWDVVVVDEAHHLSCQDGKGSPEYEAVERVSAAADGLLLLTATSTQLGEEGHFARLRLLDPERHADFAAWQREDKGHQEAAQLGAALCNLSGNTNLPPASLSRLAEILELTTDDVEQRVAEPGARDRLLAELIDRHGPGRVIFANTRSVLNKQPERKVLLTPLEPLASLSSDSQTRAPRRASGHSKQVRQVRLSTHDPRIEHLVSLLRSSGDEKLLVTCRTAATARAIKEALDQRVRADIALFHEDIELVQRDRNAAWFVEPTGARMLVCSEIGSEGRNFQHARHLVMFDLPVDPDLVEQRIGRIDRIGQRGDVLIDVPYVAGTGHEILARWHHEGVDTFGQPIATARPLLERFGNRVRALADRWTERGTGGTANPPDEQLELELNSLIAETAQATRELKHRVESGRDRLLEMSSLHHDVADELLAEIREHDNDVDSDDLYLRVLEHFQVIADELGPRTYRFDQDGLARVSFAALTRGDVTFTFDRRAAVLREDFEFASMDHPLMLDALGMLLDTEAGKASFAIQQTSGAPTLLLEASFVLEVVAPPRLHADRFLPPTCLRVVVDQTGADRSDESDSLTTLEAGDNGWFREQAPQLRGALQQMLRQAEGVAETRADKERADASGHLIASLSAEIERLRALARSNPLVRPEEITLVEDELEELGRHVAAARLRLDAVRLVWRGPAAGGVPQLR